MVEIRIEIIGKKNNLAEISKTGEFHTQPGAGGKKEPSGFLFVARWCKEPIRQEKGEAQTKPIPLSLSLWASADGKKMGNPVSVVV